MKTCNNKQKNLCFFSHFFVFSFFLLLSLACARTCTTAEAYTRTIKLQHVNDYVKNQELNISSKSPITRDKLIEIIKLSINNGELKNLTLVEENTRLNYCVLTSNAELYTNKPLSIDFSCTIAESGNLKLKLLDIREQDSINKPFKFIVNTYEYEESLDSIKLTILKHLENIGKKILSLQEDIT